MNEQPVHEQLAVALKGLASVLRRSYNAFGQRYSLSVSETNVALRKASKALERHRAKPKTHHREDLLIALDELFQCDLRSIPPDEWVTAKDAFKAAISELQCPDGCDTSCRCYQEGLTA